MTDETFFAPTAQELAFFSILIGDAPLTTRRRKALADSEFALPDTRQYPIDTVRRARNALARVSQHGTPDQIKKVRAAVQKRYPQIQVSTD